MMPRFARSRPASRICRDIASLASESRDNETATYPSATMAESRSALSMSLPVATVVVIVTTLEHTKIHNVHYETQNLPLKSRRGSRAGSGECRRRRGRSLLRRLRMTGGISPTAPVMDLPTPFRKSMPVSTTCHRSLEMSAAEADNGWARRIVLGSTLFQPDVVGELLQVLSLEHGG